MILRSSLGTALLVLLLALVAISPPQAAPACATAPPQNKPVEIADESAIIIWDAKSKTEHFIRRATFKTYAQDFGFLVPTPTKPTLAEADDETFSELAKITAPRVLTQAAPSGGGGCVCAPKAAAPAVYTTTKSAAEPTVRVLDTKSIAGYDAAVLEADDADALTKWLEEHSYDVSPRLKEWVAPYIKAKWKITAFKIAKPDGKDQDVSTSAVRMTFQTDKPFFPYREPAADVGVAEKIEKLRLLRVFFLSNSRVQGTIGEKGATWPGTTEWANHLSAEQREHLLRQLKLDANTPPPSWWLTEFEDHSTPRPGTDDVFFSSSADQSTVERDLVIKYVSRKVPDCVMCYALAAYMVVPGLIRWVRRKSKQGDF